MAEGRMPGKIFRSLELDRAKRRDVEQDLRVLDVTGWSLLHVPNSTTCPQSLINACIEYFVVLSNNT